jgi:hypothetical protein
MIIALGALTAARHEICQKYGFYDYGKISNSNRHHQYALQQYSKALKGMREAFQDFTKDSIQPLIASLLVFCFECLLGHRSAASAHASSTVSLISELQFKRLDGSLAFSAPEPHPLDIDLYAAFSNLDLQALLFVDNRPWTTHQSLHNEMNNIIQKIPDLISDIKNCRNYWQAIMRRNLHFVAIARAATINTPPPKESVNEIATLCLGNNIWTNPPVESRGLYSFLPIERELCIKDIRKWERASAALFEATCDPAACDDTQDFLISSLLKIHAAMNIVLLSRTFYPPEITTDEFLPEFKTIVDLSYGIKHLLITTPSADKAPLFHFDIGILPALSQVGLLCRDKEVRGRAIALLLDNPGYREAIWESDAVGQICDFVRGMEEVWCDEKGFVPGDRRATMLGVEFEGRSCKAEFVQRMGPREGDVVVRSECFTW